MCEAQILSQMTKGAKPKRKYDKILNDGNGDDFFGKGYDGCLKVSYVIGIGSWGWKQRSMQGNT